MNSDVAVTVSCESFRVVDLDTAEHKLSVSDDFVYIGSDADTIFWFWTFNHNFPFVLGMSAPVILTACASACPMALNTASAMWWLLIPYGTFMCRLNLPLLAKLFRNSSRHWTSKSPIFSVRNSTW